MIRRATIDDARPIADVHTRTWQAAYRHVFPRELLDEIDVHLAVEVAEIRYRISL
jgi:hypothetical protein